MQMCLCSWHAILSADLVLQQIQPQAPNKWEAGQRDSDPPPEYLKGEHEERPQPAVGKTGKEGSVESARSWVNPSQGLPHSGDCQQHQDKTPTLLEYKSKRVSDARQPASGSRALGAVGQDEPPGWVSDWNTLTALWV